MYRLWDRWEVWDITTNVFGTDVEIWDITTNVFGTDGVIWDITTNVFGTDVINVESHKCP